MKNKIKKIIEVCSNLIFYATMFVFFISFNFRDNPSNGWTLQLLTELNGVTINDVTFLDSLTGFIATSTDSTNISFIYKTTNSGNNWITKKTNTHPFTNISFCSNNVGYCSSWDTIFKTTNNGDTWKPIPNPFGFWSSDISVLDENNIWVVDKNGLTGGLFRTTDGGQSWIRQYYSFQQNPDKVYMVNKNLGFMSKDQNYSARTTDGGFNWSISTEDSTIRFIEFADSLTGWRSFVNVKKTTNGGITWENQQLPNIENVVTNKKFIRSYSLLNNDTVFGVGGYYRLNNFTLTKGIVYKTTNGGLNWGYQIPDTSYEIPQYWLIKFINKKTGWAFNYKDKDIYTTTGGSDTTFYTGINNNTITEIPKGFELFQNYPNPFNQTTNIKYQITNKNFIIMKVYDISGKEVAIILNEDRQPGKYSIRFDAAGLASGIYFYQLIADGKNIDTKKMVILK